MLTMLLLTTSTATIVMLDTSNPNLPRICPSETTVPAKGRRKTPQKQIPSPPSHKTEPKKTQPMMSNTQGKLAQLIENGVVGLLWVWC